MALVMLSFVMSGCASIPGKTGTEQAQSIDELVEKTLKDLAQQHPGAPEEIAQSKGYAIFSNKITKIPVVGAGAGYGVALRQPSGERTYMRMTRFDFGAGWGARSVRPVLIFFDEQKFQQFIDGAFKVKMGAEASAKVGEAGAAGGMGGVSNDPKAGYKGYLITDAGVSATWSVGFVHVKPIKIKPQGDQK